MKEFSKYLKEIYDVNIKNNYFMLFVLYSKH